MTRRQLIAATVFLTLVAPAFGQIPAMLPKAEPPLFMDEPARPWRCYIGADMLIWTRTTPNVPLLVDRTTGAALFESGDTLPFNWTVAPRVTLGTQCTDRFAIEASWFGIYDWGAQGTTSLDARTAPVAALSLPNVVKGFVPGESQRYDYSVRLTNAELNVRNSLSERVSVLAGFRYLNLGEEFNANLINANGIFFGNYGARTENNLFGAHIGGDYAVKIGERCQVTGVGKAGIFGAAENQTTFGSFLTPTPGPRPLYGERRADACQVAFVAEVGLMVSYEVRPWLTFRGGYHVMWIDGVALATNQLTTSNWAPGGAAGIDTRGSVFMHGAIAGMEFRW